jgi:hypothetical protein
MAEALSSLVAHGPSRTLAATSTCRESHSTDHPHRAADRDLGRHVATKACSRAGVSTTLTPPRWFLAGCASSPETKAEVRSAATINPSAVEAMREVGIDHRPEPEAPGVGDRPGLRRRDHHGLRRRLPDHPRHPLRERAPRRPRRPRPRCRPAHPRRPGTPRPHPPGSDGDPGRQENLARFGYALWRQQCWGQSSLDRTKSPSAGSVPRSACPRRELVYLQGHHSRRLRFGPRWARVWGRAGVGKPNPGI